MMRDSLPNESNIHLTSYPNSFVDLFGATPSRRPSTFCRSLRSTAKSFDSTRRNSTSRVLIPCSARSAQDDSLGCVYRASPFSEVTHKGAVKLNRRGRPPLAALLLRTKRTGSLGGILSVKLRARFYVTV